VRGEMPGPRAARLRDGLAPAVNQISCKQFGNQALHHRLVGWADGLSVTLQRVVWF